MTDTPTEASRRVILAKIHTCEVNILRAERLASSDDRQLAIARLDGEISGLRTVFAALETLGLALEWPAENILSPPMPLSASDPRSTVHIDTVYEPVKVCGIVCDSTRFTISLRVGAEWVLLDYTPTTPGLPRPIANSPWCVPGQRLELQIVRAPLCRDHDECRVDDDAHRRMAASCTPLPSIRLFVERAKASDRGFEARSYAAIASKGSRLRR